MQKQIKRKFWKRIKGKVGIYQWAHLESSKIYIGFSVDLSKRFNNYFDKSNLKRTDNYISKALLLHRYSAFSLSILKLIDISGLSKEEARKLILERKNSYLKIIFSKEDLNIYNLNPNASSRLEANLSEETKALISKSLAGNTPTKETLAKLSKAKTGKITQCTANIIPLKLKL